VGRSFQLVHLKGQNRKGHGIRRKVGKEQLQIYQKLLRGSLLIFVSWGNT
jgi:hypothetical protein